MYQIPESGLKGNDSEEYGASWVGASGLSDTDAAAQMAALQPGKHVLDLGCGGGSFIVDAKARVGPTGVCVAVDGVQGFLNVDLPHALQLRGLPALSVHTLCRNVTDGALPNQLRAVLTANGVPEGQ